MLRSRVTWNAVATFSKKCVAKLDHRVLLLYLVVSSSCTTTPAIRIAARVRRELQGSARLLMQPSILDLNFWHRSFLTTIMVDYYPLFEFACMQQY